MQAGQLEPGEAMARQQGDSPGIGVGGGFPWAPRSISVGGGEAGAGAAGTKAVGVDAAGQPQPGPAVGRPAFHGTAGQAGAVGEGRALGQEHRLHHR